ncbi:MAG: hypothetical protein EP343_28550 [Deltaproteobacteria bacterium]|nr:MAG: hypothetical protein EP343_28550 [Deltaproteobacteria bacterium]
MHRRLLQLVLVLNVVGFVAFLMVSNGHDWDAFFTFLEVEQRAWMVDGSPPLWSYQLCGGITRIGDPQSFGLSPLFLWVLAFGSFWGGKLLVVCCMLLGWWLTVLLLKLLVWGDSSEQGTGPDADDRLMLWALAQMFVMGNFFLWHLHMGHVSFCMFYLGLGLVYFTLKAWLGNFRWRHAFWGVLLSWTYYSSAFFQSTVYFLVPIFLCLGVLVVVALGRRVRQQRPLRPLLQRLGWMAGFHLVGIGLGAYKLVSMFHYQSLFPRELPLHRTEYGDVLAMAWTQLMPSWNFRFMGSWNASGAYPYVWEHSFLNLCAWCFVVFVLFHLVQRLTSKEGPSLKVPKTHRSVLWGLGIYFAVVFLFALGEWSRWLPHSLLRDALGGGIRVISRYQIGFALLLLCVLALLLRWDRTFRTFFVRWVALPALLLVGANFFLFGKGSSVSLAKALHRAWAASNPGKGHMKQVVFTRPRDFHSYGYPPLLQNYAVLNCYNPIRSVRNIRKQLRRQGIPLYNKAGTVVRYRLRKSVFSFIDTHHYKPPQRCIQNSYFTQQTFHLDASCPRKLCLNLSHLNLYKKTEFRFDPKRQKYCRE